MVVFILFIKATSNAIYLFFLLRSWVWGVYFVWSFSLCLCCFYQRTSSPAKTVASGIAARGTCKPTSCTTAPADRSSPPPPRPLRRTNPRSPTPTSAFVPSRSATRAAPVPAHWRSTCAPTAVRAANRPHTRQQHHSIPT